MKRHREFSPTAEQQALLDHEWGCHARVLAGPGTGKSVTLVALINRLSNNDERRKVRLLTFTRAATTELAEKVSETRTAARERPSTIHSFAISVLMKNGSSGF